MIRQIGPCNLRRQERTRGRLQRSRRCRLHGHHRCHRTRCTHLYHSKRAYRGQSGIMRHGIERLHLNGDRRQRLGGGHRSLQIVGSTLQYTVLVVRSLTPPNALGHTVTRNINDVVIVFPGCAGHDLRPNTTSRRRFWIPPLLHPSSCMWARDAKRDCRL